MCVTSLFQGVDNNRGCHFETACRHKTVQFATYSIEFEHLCQQGYLYPPFCKPFKYFHAGGGGVYTLLACTTYTKNIPVICMYVYVVLYCYCTSFLIQYSSKCGFLHGLWQSVQTTKVQIIMVSIIMVSL